jgi:HAE1 family hydrophobic/amphiphilic exporter-1
MRKQSGTNTVAVVDAVNEKLGDVKKLLPAGYEVEDRAGHVASHPHQRSRGEGASRAGGHFRRHRRFDLPWQLTRHHHLRARHSHLHHRRVRRYVGAGTHINVISLVALALAVGIVIDDAIIVVENIFRHMEEKKRTPSPPPSKAPKEIGMAVLATTLSLLAVFVPVAFLSGIVGMFLKQFRPHHGLSPSRCRCWSASRSRPRSFARMFRNGHATRFDAWLEHLVNIFYRPVEAFYMVLLRFSMRHRWIIVLGCFGILAAVPTLMKIVQKSFLPPVEEAEFVVNIRTPEGTSFAATDLMAERFARAIRELPGVDGTLLTIGDNDQRTPNLAGIFVRLNDPLCAKTSRPIMDRVRTRSYRSFPTEWRITVLSVPPFNTGHLQRQRAVLHRRA